MKEGDDEEFLRLVSDKKFNLNQYDTLKIFEFFEGIRRTPLQKACYLENPYYVEKLLENTAILCRFFAKVLQKKSPVHHT